MGVYYTPWEELIVSVGSPIIQVRVPQQLLDQVDAVVASERRGEPWTRSSFFIHCVKAELAKRQRSRTWRASKKGATHEQH